MIHRPIIQPHSNPFLLVVDFQVISMPKFIRQAARRGEMRKKGIR